MTSNLLADFSIIETNAQYGENLTSKNPIISYDSSVWHDNSLSHRQKGYFLHPSSKKVAINKINLSHVSTTQIGLSKIDIFQPRFIPDNIFQVTPFEINPSHSRTVQIDPAQISSLQTNFIKESGFQKDINKNRSVEIYSGQTSIIQSSTTQINLTQINIDKIDSTQTYISEIPFSSIIPSEQLLSSDIHNSNLQTINQLNNSVNHIWSTLLPQTNIDITYEIKDLPSGQLAEATITGFDSEGKPNAGIVSIDHDANGVGWFIDATPMENLEFAIRNSEFAFLATPDSEAYGKYDLLTTILHETAHLYGFINGYSEFDKNVRYQNGRRTFVGDNFTAFLSDDGSHLDQQAHPYDLLKNHIAPGIRKLPSDINVLILNAIQNTKTDTYHTLIPHTDNHDHDLVPPLQRGARGDSSTYLDGQFPSNLLTAQPTSTIAQRRLQPIEFVLEAHPAVNDRQLTMDN